jgi:isopentenyl phosphate kinase
MTQDALRALRDAVKAGTFQRVDWPFAEWPLKVSWEKVYLAYTGSLDAAHALHKAVLPGYSPIMFGDGVQVHLSVSSIISGDYQIVEGNPARAWLLAIL